MKQNYFEFFQLPIAFALNEADLMSRYRAIIAKVHPDRYTDKSAVEQRVALQWSTYANEAFETLKSPIKRAQYLLRLHEPTLAIDDEYVSLPPDFLMQQMTWREALENGAAELVHDEVNEAHSNALAQLTKFCESQDWVNTRSSLAQCQFIENFIKQLP